MSRSANQKLKLLYLAKYLWKATDEAHAVTVADMIGELRRYNINAERKSVYDDLEALRLFGMDVIAENGKYRVGSRLFELPELKLLVDSVQSSKFITEKKTPELIDKLERLASDHEARQLQRQVYVRGRVKTMNESIYYNVDEISGAITANREIRFHYFEYGLDKQRHNRRGGAFYEASPLELTWDDENYYMVGWEAAAAQIKHYRVDKMADIAATETPRRGVAALTDAEITAYDRKVFGMFTGDTERVKLRFTNRLVSAVLDRFGQDVALIPDGAEHFTVSVDIAVSPQFYAWVFAYGDEAELLSPDCVRLGMCDIARRVAALYVP